MHYGFLFKCRIIVNNIVSRRGALSSKEESLRTELKKQVERFRKESNRHKRIYRTLRYITFGLTGFSTFVASAALSFKGQQEWLNLAVVFATAIAGIATSIEGLRKPSELWIHERNIFYALTDLEREMNYEASESGGLKNADDYFNRLQYILTTSTENWSRKVKPSGEGKPS
ncbi:MAG: hypothetical protein B6D34_08730 [Candidatus Brocadia sp. UTAMX1]|jgi:hypothetical protein|nr:MAG: hypothetical protein B6D34_08730 [Candidatus Brocadia sp. UTAMX1]